jgi:uncharacterized protein YndB with AHSA1/START domain
LRDVLDQIDAAHREISAYPVAAGEGRSLLLRRTYDASADDVWNACTDPARISRWLAPVSGDLRLGGAFRIEGRATGEILCCDKPRLLKVTWEYGQESVTEVEVRLSKDSRGGTLFELRHASPVEIVDELVRTQGPAGAIMNGASWDLVLLDLDGFLRGEDLDTARRKDTLRMREFTIRSYRAWGAASQAAWEISTDRITTVIEDLQRFAPDSWRGSDR